MARGRVRVTVQIRRHHKGHVGLLLKPPGCSITMRTLEMVRTIIFWIRLSSFWTKSPDNNFWLASDCGGCCPPMLNDATLRLLASCKLLYEDDPLILDDLLRRSCGFVLRDDDDESSSKAIMSTFSSAWTVSLMAVCLGVVWLGMLISRKFSPLADFQGNWVILAKMEFVSVLEDADEPSCLDSDLRRWRRTGFKSSFSMLSNGTICVDMVIQCLHLCCECIILYTVYSVYWCTRSLFTVAIGTLRHT